MTGPDIWLLDGQQQHETAGPTATSADGAGSAETPGTGEAVGPIEAALAETQFTQNDLDIALSVAQTVLYLVVAYYAIMEGGR